MASRRNFEFRKTEHFALKPDTGIVFLDRAHLAHDDVILAHFRLSRVLRRFLTSRTQANSLLLTWWPGRNLKRDCQTTRLAARETQLCTQYIDQLSRDRQT